MRELLEDARALESMQAVHPPSGCTALGLACGRGELSTVSELLREGATVDGDVVAHAVHEETGKKAGMALPPSFFSARSQVLTRRA